MAERPFKFDVQLKGLDKVIENLHIFSTQLQRVGARAAARKAMVPVRDDARERAKRIDDEDTRDSQIWKNIVINESQRGGKRVGGIVMRVGVRGGALSRIERTLESGKGFRYKKGTSGVLVKKFGKIKKFVVHPGGDTRHWRFVELGTQHVRARPFMLPALENNTSQVVEELAKEFNVQIDKLAHYHVSAHP